jgi:hypothetical protein
MILFESCKHYSLLVTQIQPSSSHGITSPIARPSPRGRAICEADTRPGEPPTTTGSNYTFPRIVLIRVTLQCSASTSRNLLSRLWTLNGLDCLPRKLKTEHLNCVNLLNDNESGCVFKASGLTEVGWETATGVKQGCQGGQNGKTESHTYSAHGSRVVQDRLGMLILGWG